MELYEKYLTEAASKYKKEFIKYAYEIIDNMMKSMAYGPMDFKSDAKQIQGYVVRIMETMALPEGNPNYANMKKYMPRKFNKVLFDNGEGNTYDSEWMSMTDAKQFTIAREAMLQYDKKKMNMGLKRSDLSTF